MSQENLADLRKSLDDIDAVIVSALGERARLSREIAVVKADAEGQVRDVDREAALLQHRSVYGARVGLDPAFVRRIFREILDDSVRRQHDALQTARDEVQQEMRVAYQGTEGAYGHLAACQHFGVSSRPVTLKPYPTFRKMLEAVLESHADRGVLPIENTTAGSVFEAYDLLLRLNLSIVGEEIVDVRHCLLGVADVPLESIRRIHSHPQALAQCSEFLSALTVEEVPAANTALAAERIGDLKDPAEAAIASEEAGAHFGLRVLRRDIADQPVNYTRFVVVAAAPVECDPRIAAKVSVGTRDAPRTRRTGALFKRTGRRRAQSHEARVASPAWRSLGVRLLSRHRGTPHRASNAGSANGISRAHVVCEDSGVLRGQGQIETASVQRFRGSEVQRFRGFRGSEVQRFRGSRVECRAKTAVCKRTPDWPNQPGYNRSLKWNAHLPSSSPTP